MLPKIFEDVLTISGKAGFDDFLIPKALNKHLTIVILLCYSRRINLVVGIDEKYSNLDLKAGM